MIAYLDNGVDLLVHEPHEAVPVPLPFGSHVQLGIFAREHAAGCFSALLLIGEAPLKVYVARGEQRTWQITPYPRDGRYFGAVRGWV